MTGKNRISLIKCVDEAICYGRYQSLMRQLIKRLPEGYSWKLYSSSAIPESDLGSANVKHIRIPFSRFKVLSRIWRLFAFIHAALSSQVLLIVGTPGILMIPLVRYLGRCKVILHADNLPMRWMGKSLLIKLRNKIYEKIAVRHAHLIIADTVELQTYLKEQYNIESSLIPFGEDHLVSTPQSESFADTFPFSKEKYALHICKISTISPVELILKGFAQFPKYHLVMVANWSDSAKGKRLRKHFNSYENIHLLEPIHDWESLNYLRSNAFVYIHFQEGWGPNLSLIEAKSLSLPILAFDLMNNNPTDQSDIWYFSHTNQMISQLQKSILHTYFQERKAAKPAFNPCFYWQDFIYKLDVAIQYCLTNLAKKKKLDFDSFYADKKAVAMVNPSPLVPNKSE